MKKEIRTYLSTGFIVAALAVIIGAFGAHALQDRISAHYLDVYETANKYHFIHSLGMLISIYILSGVAPIRKLKWVFLFFLLGIILFSGSLYVLSLADYLNMPQLKMLGAITPIGGLFFIAGWLYSAYLLLRSPLKA